MTTERKPVGVLGRGGRYRLLEELGAGGMAQVFRADDTVLRREVAVKLLYPHLTRAPESKARFVREARAAAGLDHPGILKVFDVDEGEEGDGAPFIVMELIRGKTLKQFVDENGPPLAEVVALAGAALAGALAVAHAAGVVHRDVKPANVMVAAGGRLVLCDFGVARVIDDDALATQSGMVLGTPAYMPPEQALGRRVDERSDVYSLGATLYHLATGGPPFSGSASAVVQDVIRGRLVSPLRRNPTVGVDLARVIERAMAREPPDRPAGARALGELCGEVAAASGVAAPELSAYFADPAGWNQRATPRILEATLARARAAASEGKAARALALAERLLAFDPASAEANALVARLGVASRRRRQATLLVVAAGSVAALALGSWAILWRDDALPDAAVALLGGPIDAAAAVPASVDMPDAAPLTEPLEAVDAGDALDATAATTARPPAPAPQPHPRPSPPPRPPAIDAGLESRSAGGQAAPDAAPPAPPARASVLVRVRPWCEIAIDGVARGRSPAAAPLELAPGRHTLRCEQPATGRAIERVLELAPGEAITVSEDLLGEVPVTIGITDALVVIDGTLVPPGRLLKLAPGRHRVELRRGQRQLATDYVHVPPRPCTLRSSPELACYED